MNVLGTIEVLTLMKNNVRRIRLLVVDDNTMFSPVLLGRDALKLFGLIIAEKQASYDEAVY